jgi:hypothetical protein
MDAFRLSSPNLSSSASVCMHPPGLSAWHQRAAKTCSNAPSLAAVGERGKAETFQIESHNVRFCSKLDGEAYLIGLSPKIDCRFSAFDERLRSPANSRALGQPSRLALTPPAKGFNRNQSGFVSP